MPQPQEFIAVQTAERQPLHTKIQKGILANDSLVSSVVEPMKEKYMAA